MMAAFVIFGRGMRSQITQNSYPGFRCHLKCVSVLRNYSQRMAANDVHCPEIDGQAEHLSESRTERVSQGKTVRPSLAMRLTIGGIQKKFPRVKSITTQTLATLIEETTSVNSSSAALHGVESKSKLLILDTRAPEEAVVGRIPGSVTVNFEDDMDTILSSIPKLRTAADGTTTVVCYCSVGYRSSTLVDKLAKYFHKQGKEDLKIYNLEGSIFQWANEGRPMVDVNGQPTPCTHPYNSLFGKMLNEKLRQTHI